MNPAIIIGIGSPYGDDQVGWQVVERLRDAAEIAGMVMLIRDRPGIRLLEDVKGYHRAILIDAVHSGAPVGTLHCLDMDRLEEISVITSSHGFGLAETLGLGKTLAILPAEISIYGIEIEPEQRDRFQAPLTPAVAATAERLFRLLSNVLLRSDSLSSPHPDPLPIRGEGS